MPAKGDFLLQLRATFLVEAREHVQAISSGILSLEQERDKSQQLKIIEGTFRAAHSLKGAARAAEFDGVEALCQSLEDVFAALRRDPGLPPPEVIDVLHRALDSFGVMLDEADRPESGGGPNAQSLRRELRGLANAYRARGTASFSESANTGPTSINPVQETTATEPDGSPPARSLSSPRSLTTETVRVALPKLETQLFETEELLVAKLASHQRVDELRELDTWFKQWRGMRSSAEPHVRALGRLESADPHLSRVINFLEWSETAVRTLERRLTHISRMARSDHSSFSKSVDGLLESAKDLLLLPFSSISASFSKLVRDLCRTEGKEADLVIKGDHFEVDKRILEEIKDPLIHMLRNAVAHAVELPSVRASQGKAPRATIVLEVSQAEGNRIQIVLRDDGAGMDPAQLRESAVSRGLVTRSEAEQLDDKKALVLAFRSEVSTGALVTKLSGRGLGLAIVQEHTSRLGGEIRLESQLGQGTAFTILLPAVRTTFRGVVCEVGGRPFLISVAAVDRALRVRLEDVQTIEGRETVRIGEKMVPLVRLGDVLDVQGSPNAKAGEIQALVVGTGDQSTAFIVDRVLQEQEVLVKPLGKPLLRVRNIAGAALLGSGKVVPILNESDLLRSARTAPRAQLSQTSDSEKADPNGRRSILVAEDSITSRMLLRAILEAAGYDVKTAADGLEAYYLLRSEHFDLLVSDVEMPRLNGFDLTARLRAEEKLADLPVILVTALASREDQERGIDVGADAYITKGSFDQDNLIEAVARLV